MPKKELLEGITLTGHTDIFKPTVKSFDIADGETIVEIPLGELYPPDYHPFQVNDDESMTRLSENIRLYGVREPGFVRPRENGGYELLCGNRRKRACEIIGKDTMLVIIREMNDDDAAIAMVDSNLEQREKLLLSEKAAAYKVKLDAIAA